MRHSEFWTLVEDEFGSAHGRALVHDHVLRAMGYRTAEQALAGRSDPRDVWLALCEELDVPPERRWGIDPKQRRSRR